MGHRHHPWHLLGAPSICVIRFSVVLEGSQQTKHSWSCCCSLSTNQSAYLVKVRNILFTMMNCVQRNRRMTKWYSLVDLIAQRNRRLSVENVLLTCSTTNSRGFMLIAITGCNSKVSSLFLKKRMTILHHSDDDKVADTIYTALVIIRRSN